MNILEALSQQKKKPEENKRIMCENGLLSISDAVFEANISLLGYDDEDIDYYLTDIPLDKREQFLRQIGAYDE
jgi:bifunctional N-acetylglucosamine-1-phosphate-uridyltransferase/glucosamine-1-phosphate-acetyltransferase GlmU-like protein